MNRRSWEQKVESREKKSGRTLWEKKSRNKKKKCRNFKKLQQNTVKFCYSRKSARKKIQKKILMYYSVLIFHRPTLFRIQKWVILCLIFDYRFDNIYAKPSNIRGMLTFRICAIGFTLGISASGGERLPISFFNAVLSFRWVLNGWGRHRNSWERTVQSFGSETVV